MPRYIISIEKFDEQLDREIGLEELVMCKDCKYYDREWWMGDCHLERWGDGWGNYPPPTVTEDGFCAWGERREDAETVRHGHWINTGFLTAKCSVCDAEVHELEYGNYCPNCGAKMDEVTEDAKN